MSTEPDNTIDDGGTAFPLACTGHFAAGMTLRDYFAGQALAGLMADPNCGCRGDESKRQLAAGCYSIADAMLKARAQ